MVFGRNRCRAETPESQAGMVLGLGVRAGLVALLSSLSLLPPNREAPVCFHILGYEEMRRNWHPALGYKVSKALCCPR